MYVIIVGGGGVSYELARNLSEKEHDVVVIEKNAEKAKRFKEALDVMVIESDGANAVVLEQAGIKKTDMLVAVTQSDEVNIIACMVAKQYGVPITVCRVRNPEYVGDSSVLTPQQLGIDVVINPEKVAALEISKMLHFPDASEIEYFNHGKVMMVGITIEKEADITGVPLRDLPINPEAIIVGIKDAEGGFIVPGGNDIVHPGNKIYLLGKSKALKDISSLLHHEHKRINQVMIMGGGIIGVQLAHLLENSKQRFDIKIIEKDVERCEELCRDLNRTLVLEGDATEIAMLEEEETDLADAVVAVTGDDRSNIVVALLARQFGVSKIICEVMRPQYVPVYSTLGIDSVINPRILAASQIIRLTRKENAVAYSLLQDENAEVEEIILPENAKVAHKKIVNAHLPRGILIGSIVRGDEVIVPRGETMLLPGDHLVIFAVPKVSAHLDRFFALPRGLENKEYLKNKLVHGEDV